MPEKREDGKNARTLLQVISIRKKIMIESTY